MIDERGAALYNRAMLPSDPYMLLSAVNMKLRDSALSLDELSKEEDASVEEITEKLERIGYVYDEKSRRFIAM